MEVRSQRRTGRTTLPPGETGTAPFAHGRKVRRVIRLGRIRLLGFILNKTFAQPGERFQLARQTSRSPERLSDYTERQHCEHDPSRQHFVPTRSHLTTNRRGRSSFMDCRMMRRAALRRSILIKITTVKSGHAGPAPNTPKAGCILLLGTAFRISTAR